MENNSFFINEGKEYDFNSFCKEKNLKTKDIDALLEIVTLKSDVKFGVPDKYLQDVKNLNCKPREFIAEKLLDIYYQSECLVSDKLHVLEIFGKMSQLW